MTEFERKQLEMLKAINRNINYLGRKLEETNKILEKHGIAVIPTGVEAAEKESETEPVVRVSDIEAWNKNFYDNLSVDHNLNDLETAMVFGWINRMLKALAKQDKIISIDIQKGE